MLFKTAWKRPSEKADALKTPDHTPEAVPSPSHSYGATIQAMFEKVKKSSKVTDANGEPLVVYHGSFGEPIPPQSWFLNCFTSLSSLY